MKLKDLKIVEPSDKPIEIDENEYKELRLELLSKGYLENPKRGSYWGRGMTWKNFDKGEERIQVDFGLVSGKIGVSRYKRG